MNFLNPLEVTLKKTSLFTQRPSYRVTPCCLLGIVVQPPDLHLVNVRSIPTGPTHGAKRLQPHPGDVLESTPNVRKSTRSGLNLEGRLSDPQFRHLKQVLERALPLRWTVQIATFSAGVRGT